MPIAVPIGTRPRSGRVGARLTPPDKARALSPPFAYFGGKAASRVQHYIEPFAGLASVLLARERVNLETLCDASAEVTHWHLACQRHPVELCRGLVEMMPVRSVEAVSDRAAWLSRTAPPRFPDVDVDRAVVWAHVRIFHRMRTETSLVGVRRDWTARRRIPTPERIAQRIHQIAWRLRGVQVLSEDAIDVIARMCGCPQVVVYADPPYRGHERDYVESFDRQRMLEILTGGGLRAAVAVSGYIADWPELDAAGWARHEMQAWTAPRNGGPASSRRECVWTSYRSQQGTIW